MDAEKTKTSVELRTAKAIAANRARKAAGLPTGRPKGSQNKLTAHVREALMHAYDQLGGHDGFAHWAARHKTAFYSLLLKSVPREREANAIGTGVHIVIATADSLRPAIDITPTSEPEP